MVLSDEALLLSAECFTEAYDKCRLDVDGILQSFQENLFVRRLPDRSSVIALRKDVVS